MDKKILLALLLSLGMISQSVVADEKAIPVQPQFGYCKGSHFAWMVDDSGVVFAPGLGFTTTAKYESGFIVSAYFVSGPPSNTPTGNFNKNEDGSWSMVGPERGENNMQCIQMLIK